MVQWFNFGWFFSGLIGFLVVYALMGIWWFDLIIDGLFFVGPIKWLTVVGIFFFFWWLGVEVVETNGGSWWRQWLWTAEK